jgi:hypothetical protein
MSDDREDVKLLSDLAYWKVAGQAGETTGQAQTIPQASRADLFCTAGSELVATTRSGQSMTGTFNAGQPITLDGRVFTSFNAPDDDWLFAIVPRDAKPTFPSIAPGGGGSGGLQTPGPLIITSTASPASPPISGTLAGWISGYNAESGVLALDAPTGVIVGYNSAAYLDLHNGIYLSASSKILRYNGIATAGNAIPAIYGATSPTHKTNAAPATTTYASPAAGFYRITLAVDVKTATTLSLKMAVTYTDSEGTAQTDVLVFTKENSTTLLTAVVAADRHSAVYSICTNGATNIVVEDDSGTYTTCDYYYAVSIEQLA